MLNGPLCWRVKKQHAQKVCIQNENVEMDDHNKVNDMKENECIKKKLQVVPIVDKIMAKNL